MDVEKAIMRHNIYYNYMRTGVYLREMAEQGLIKMEERIAKRSKNRYYLWKFHELWDKIGEGITDLPQRLDDFVVKEE